ncbi:MAG: PH domain-containing protein [Halobacteriales archaeon]
MRLDPRSIPYRGLQQGVRWAVGVGTLGLVLNAAADLDLDPALVAGAVAAAGVAGVGWAVAYHRRFAFELTADSLDITSGVLSRRTREIPLGRIQNVDVRQGLAPRLLGVAEVRFETAGGAGTEARLRYVDLAVARDLQERVDRHGERPSAGESAAHDPSVASDDEPDATGEPLYAMTTAELALLSVTSVDWRALGFVALAALGVLPGAAGPGVGVAPLAPLAAAAQPAALTVAGVLGNAALLTARFYRFRLWRRRETLRYERGLLRRFSGSIPLDRVHRLRLRDNPATRRLGFAALDIETAGYGPESGEESAAAVPIADRDRVVALARSVETFPELDLVRPPARARRRYVVRYAAAAVLATVGLFALDQFWRPVPWFLGLALLAATPVAAQLTWTHRGYALGERALLVRSGFWRRTTAVVPLYRVQTVGTTATVLQRRRSLATLRVDTASGAAAAHDLDAADADELREAVARGLREDRARRAVERRQTRPASQGSSAAPGPNAEDEAAEQPGSATGTGQAENGGPEA